MSKTKHTPGLWRVERDDVRDVNLTIFNDLDRIVADCDFGGRTQAVANANLIAAAPDLLAALEGLNRGPSDDWCICPHGFTPMGLKDHHFRCAAARAALVKAKGEGS